MTERLSDERVAAIATCRVERSLPDGGMWTASLWEVTELAREVLELREAVERLRPPSFAQLVAVSDEMVAELRAHPSAPVTLEIREGFKPHWLEFVCRRHDCPAPPALGGEG